MSGIPILCYHKVGPVSDVGRFLNIEPARFVQHLNFFKRRGYRFLTANELPNCGFKGRQVCLTFDDAYTSAMTFGLEAMVRAGVRATYYAVSDLVGKASEWDGARAQPLAPSQLLLEAEALGFEIGNHTATHQRLSELSEDAQAHEIERGFRSLSDLGLRIKTFAFPYGSLSDVAPEIVGRSHQAGLALGKRLATSADSLNQLPRFVVACGDTVPLLVYKIWMRNRFRQVR